MVEGFVAEDGSELGGGGVEVEEELAAPVDQDYVIVFGAVDS
jgi:hypothetical protein